MPNEISKIDFQYSNCTAEEQAIFFYVKKLTENQHQQYESEDKEIMSNESVRERVKKYIEEYGATYSKIGRDCGFDGKSYYLISRFMRGQKLNDTTLQAVDSYLVKRGF